MTTLSELILKLEELENKHGDVPVNIYYNDTETININIDEIHYDEKLKDVYIGIY